MTPVKIGLVSLRARGLHRKCPFPVMPSFLSHPPTEEGHELFRVAEKSHANWVKLYLEGNASEVLLNVGKKVLKQYLDALKAMNAALSRQLGKYDMYSMVLGMVLILQVHPKRHGGTRLRITRSSAHACYLPRVFLKNVFQFSLQRHSTFLLPPHSWWFLKN